MLSGIQEEALSKRCARSERTCVTCGKKDAPDALLRVTRTPIGGVVIDWRRNLGGRGANVCPSRECVETAVKRRLFGRVLKSEVRYPNADELIDTARIALHRQLETLIRSGVASRHVALGAQPAEQLLKARDVHCLVVAEDSAGRHRFAEMAVASGVPIVAIESKDLLGAIVGRSVVGVAAVKNIGLATALIRVLGRLEALK